MSSTPQNEPDDLARRLKELCWEALQLDQARRWHSGQRVPTEAYLRQLPDLAADDQGIVDQVYNEILLRRQLGETPTADEYLQRFPERAQELRDQFEFEQFVQGGDDPIDEMMEQSAKEQGSQEGLPQVPGYEMLEPLGKGGMGIVYKARQTKLDRLVALKMIRAGELAGAEEQQRFQAEIEAIARVAHPGIVQIYHVDQVNGRPFFVMEFLGGGSLADRLQKHPQPPRCAARLVEKLARGMEAAHQAGVIHRDLKPANILLAGDANTPLDLVEPKIADFGLAKKLDDNSDLTRTGALLGSPTYMSPEQAASRNADIGPHSDIHALGVILYELLTGRPPFSGTDVMQTLAQVREQEPVSPRRLQPEVPRDLETICLKCLQKESTRRYNSASALADDLARFREGKPILARPVGRIERLWRWCRRNPTTAMLAGSIAVLILLAVVGITHFAFAAQQEAASARAARDHAEVESYFSHILAAEFAWRAHDIGKAQQMLDACPESLRRWEWAFLQRLCNPQVMLCRESAGSIQSLLLSPDGKRLISTAGNSVREWDAKTGQLVRTFPVERGTYVAARIGSEGHLQAFATTADGEMKLTDLESGRVIFSGIGQAKRGPRFAVNSEETILAVGYHDGAAELWSIPSGKSIMQSRPHTKGISALAFSPDGCHVFSASSDNTIIKWDIDGKQVFTFCGHERQIRSMAFSPDGRLVASGSWSKDNRIRQDQAELILWDAATGEELQRFNGHNQRIDAVVFSGDGKTLASACCDRTIRIWDVESGKSRHLLHGQHAFHALVFTPAGQLVSGDGEGTIRWWDINREQRCQTLPLNPPKAPGGIAFDPQGRRLAVAHLNGEVRLWDVVEKRLALKLPGHSPYAYTIAFSPDGRTIASGGRDRLIRLSDAATGNELPMSPLRGHAESVQTVAFSPDGKRLASGCADGTLKLWDPLTGECQRTVSAHNRLVPVVAFSQDGKSLATAGEDRFVRLWNVASGHLHDEWEFEQQSATTLTFSPTGRWLLFVGWDRNPVVQVWDLPSRRLQAVCKGHEGKITGIVVTPDEERLMTSSDDGTLRVWELRTGREILELRDHQSGVNCVAMSRDGRRLASGGWDRTVKIWEID